MNPNRVHCEHCGASLEYSRARCSRNSGHHFVPDIVGEELASGRPTLDMNRVYSDQDWDRIYSMARDIYVTRRGSIPDPGLDLPNTQHLPVIVKRVAQNALLEAMLFWDAWCILREPLGENER